MTEPTTTEPPAEAPATPEEPRTTPREAYRAAADDVIDFIAIRQGIVQTVETAVRRFGSDPLNLVDQLRAALRPEPVAARPSGGHIRRSYPKPVQDLVTDAVAARAGWTDRDEVAADITRAVGFPVPASTAGAALSSLARAGTLESRRHPEHRGYQFRSAGTLPTGA